MRDLLAPLLVILVGELVLGEDLPRLPPKAPSIAIAPSHVVDSADALLAPEAGWQEVQQHTDLYKYYGVQVTGVPWASPLKAAELVRFSKRTHIQLACEFGDFPPAGQESFPAALRAARAQIQGIYDAGGRVHSLHLDGPIRRLIQGHQENPQALSLNQIAVGLSQFCRQLQQEHPQLAIGLITNLPNWDYNKNLPGYNGHFTDRSGVTYEQALNRIFKQLAADEVKLAFLEVDCPYNYYREKRTRNRDAEVDYPKQLLALQKWCTRRKVAFHLIVNAEPRRGGAEAFHDLTLDYLDDLQKEKIFPDVFVLQSWYKQPADHLPESTPGTFMHTAREAIRKIRKLDE